MNTDVLGDQVMVIVFTKEVMTFVQKLTPKDLETCCVFWEQFGACVGHCVPPATPQHHTHIAPTSFAHLPAQS